MGLVGPGFVGVHHIDAVRRLGFVDVVAIAASSEASARAKAESLHVERAYGSYEALVSDRDIDVVHVTTPNHLHAPIVSAAIAKGKHVVCDKPLAMSGDEAASLLEQARRAGVVHAVTFNYRGNPMVQEARALIARGDLGGVHFVHGAYLQDWLIDPHDFSWRLEPDRGGESSAVGDIGSHWCDLAEHLTGQRIVSVLADLATVVRTRIKPRRAGETFPPGVPDGGTPVTVTSEDLATILLRFDGGARGAVSIGQVCAGHKNDCWIEVNGLDASVRWRQEMQNELWFGHRHRPNELHTKDPAQLRPEARAYTSLPGGHQQGWSDAFFHVVRDIYASILNRTLSPAPALATFEDGYRMACVVDAVLASHRSGGVWVDVAHARAGSLA